MSLTNPFSRGLVFTTCAGSSVVLSIFCQAGEVGKMAREVWNGIPGNNVADFSNSPRWWQTPDSVASFAGSVAPSNTGDNYAARIRAIVIAPVTGNYTFWISSNNSSQLLLSPNESKFGRVKIASVSNYTTPQTWTWQASQKSALIPLVAGQCIFLEAIHKEGVGDDHLSIAWQIPGGTRTLIPASALESFTVDANDIDHDELPDDWEIAHGFTPVADGSGPADEGPLGDPDHDGYLNHEELELGTDPNVRGGVPGALLMETWTGVDGNKVEDLTWGTKYAAPPNSSAFVFSSETPQNRTDRFGARLRGYVIPPATGDYRFHVSGNNGCQLWLSTSDSQFQKTRIAYVDGWTVPGEWHKYPSQQSALIPLQAGVKYYLEAVMKDGVGDDHMKIGWSSPTATEIAIIPGTALESYAYDANDPDGDNMANVWEIAHGLDPSFSDAALDPDRDGITNLLEHDSGTDPQVRNSLPGALLHELWLDVPGYHVKGLTSSPKFLQQPNIRDLVTSAQTFAQPYDNFGSRIRGYLTAPVTGTYTFWVVGDAETEFWLSPSSSKYERQLLVRPNIVNDNFDGDISQKSRPVQLSAGESYYLEILHKEYYNSDYCKIAWTRPDAPREIIPGSVLRSFIPTADDQDDDDLPDEWELANGLSPNDNGHIDPKNGAHGDLDGDGLDNTAEWKSGTRADLADTDGDGVNDHDEVELMESSAITADAAPFQSIATISGAAYTATSGTWIQENGRARQDCARGWLEYPVTLGAPGVYQLDLAFTPVADVGVSPDYEVVFSVDGKTIQRETVTVADAASGHAKILSPWLAAGSHTIRVFIDNSYWFRRVTVDRLEVLASRGPDANANGTPDWVDLRLAKSNSFDAPAASITSPVCLEGKARWFEMTTLNGEPVQAAPNDGWFANVPLDPNQPTTVSASLENGAIRTAHNVTWTPVNLYESGDLTIRLSDSLRLTAFKSKGTTSNEKSIISVEGQSYVVHADEPLIHQFTTPGIIPVLVSKSDDGEEPTTTVMVHVVAAPLIESPVCVVGHYREVSIPSLSDDVTLQLDNRIDVRSITGYPSGSLLHILRLNTLDSRPAILRLDGSTGPILGTLPFRAMRSRSGGETTVLLSGDLGSNTYSYMMPVIVDGLYADVTLKFEIFISGVVFDDGSLMKLMKIPDDFTSDGETVLNFIKTGTIGANCHRTSLWQTGKRIAYFQ